MPGTIRTTKLVNARTWDPDQPGSGIDDVPVESQHNANGGAAHYLQKTLDGKRVFYSPHEWNAMSDEAKRAARIVVGGAIGPRQGRSKLSDVERMLASLSEDERAALAARIAPEATKPAKGGGR
jgi:hypothetical protein